MESFPFSWKKMLLLHTHLALFLPIYCLDSNKLLSSLSLFKFPFSCLSALLLALLFSVVLWYPTLKDFFLFAKPRSQLTVFAFIDSPVWMVQSHDQWNLSCNVCIVTKECGNDWFLSFRILSGGKAPAEIENSKNLFFVLFRQENRNIGLVYRGYREFDLIPTNPPLPISAGSYYF